MLLETQCTKLKLIACKTFPCRDVDWISTKTHNFDQNLIRLLSSMFTMLLSSNKIYKCINAILIYFNDISCI